MGWCLLLDYHFTSASFLDFLRASHYSSVQFTSRWLLFWTSYVPHTTLASNLPCSGFLFGLFLASHSSNVQSDSLRLSFWTFSVPHTTLTSNPPRVDFSFGLLLASRSSNVQPDVSPTRGRTSVRHKGAPPSDTNALSGHHDNKISSCQSGALSPPVLNERVTRI